MSIELRHLRCFLAIAEESNVTRAAARMGLTQPSVSRTLASLEKRMGVRLVDRSTHHLALTAEGRAFRDKAAAAVAGFDEALDADGCRTGPCGSDTPGRPSARTPPRCCAAGSGNIRTPRSNC